MSTQQNTNCQDLDQDGDWWPAETDILPEDLFCTEKGEMVKKSEACLCKRRHRQQSRTEVGTSLIITRWQGEGAGWCQCIFALKKQNFWKVQNTAQPNNVASVEVVKHRSTSLLGIHYKKAITAIPCQARTTLIGTALQLYKTDLASSIHETRCLVTTVVSSEDL